jgi:hypothetical protein
LREKLTTVLAEKQDAAFKDMTPDELQAQIAALS